MATTKARYWWAVCYVENMVEGWQDSIGDLVQMPYCYCIHDADADDKGEHRKDHVHVILCWPGPTTYKVALSVFQQLGEKAVNTCKPVLNMRHAYDYLIHDTESCRKAGKHLYGPEERVCGNNFDIGMYVQVSVEEKQEMLKELVGFIIQRGFATINDATVAIAREFPDTYWQVVVGYNGVLERYCRGNYLKKKAAGESMEKSATTGAKQARESGSV